ncbi:helicase-related protein, partial [Plastoroseomonas hellenica]|uniref:helicase-related protein n=1 Tax=Plastoroseomonas hellenica TaxID=2687306 RepID=UPI0020116FC5
MADHTPPMTNFQMFQPRVRAVLGPTNTGKTHLAIERLLAHASGIIGFPLRLLARENYDRMVAAKGERHVALITGEEKIIPPEAKWFACTVEAMPLDRRAEFVAVDEIQLCADPDRGHVFTDRLLNARGMVETMFMGAETIRPLLTRLVPGIEFDTRTRMSQLTYAGPAKLTRLPPRSAVVAFSAAEVYAIAEAIRRRRGGCAVVMGRLSPRTRNAQVALYQNREVDFLVATDAIGMGLNMDVDHVAFAALQKFDGHRVRALEAQEAAQIAGRAGRGMRDGSFGVTGDCPPLDDEMVGKIEGHAFEPLSQLAWRNSELDFASLDALLGSLALPPPQPGLARGNDATDHITLEALSRDPEVQRLAEGRTRVRLLWEACQVPDFRKLADDSHTKLAARIFTHLATDGALPKEWVTQSIAGLGRIDGDLDTLMARLASIRVWSYIAARADWVADAAEFQAEARRAEDAVSDALHESLTARFVDRRAAHLMRRLDDTAEELLSAVTRRGEVVVEGHNVGKVLGFAFEPEAGSEDEEQRKLVLRAARRALTSEIPRRVAALEQAKDEAFALTPANRITWTYHPGFNTPAGLGDAAEIARLRPGPEASRPQIEVLPTEFLDGAQRERIRTRLAAWIESHIGRELGAIAKVEAKAAEEGALRGPAYQLRESLGLAPGATERVVTPELRQKLKAIGVRAGRYALYLPEVMKPKAMALRAQLWALLRNIETPSLPGGGLVAIQPPADWPPGFAEAMGWLPAGGVLLRLDVAERIAAEIGFLTRRAPAMLPGDLASRLGLKADALPAALEAMGFRLMPGGELPEGHHGPPTPTRIGLPRNEGQHHHRGPRRPQGERPQGDRPQGDRPQGERPRGERRDGQR